MIGSAFEFSEGFKKELTALKKVNQIGKKLSENSKYILYDGVLYAYDKTNSSVSVSVLYPKLREALILLSPVAYRIEGDALYQMTNNADFVGYEETNDGLELRFKRMEDVKEEFDLDKFAQYASNRGFAKFDVVVAYKKGWESNMQIYNMYLNFLNTLSITTKEVEHSVLLKYVDISHKIFKRSEYILDAIKKADLVFRRDFTDEERDELLDGDLPIDCTDNDSFVRVMKNMFPVASTKTEMAVSLLRNKNEEYDWCITETDDGTAATATAFRIVRM